MGVDVYSSKGAIFTVEEFLKIVNGKNKSDVVGACHTFYQELVDAENANTDCEWRRSHPQWRSQLVESYKSLSTLKKTMKLSEIRDVISSIVTVEGEPSKYGSCYVNDSEFVQELFDLILDACPEAKNLPPIQEIEAWGSSRYNGWDVPLGVACVVFDSESCFTKTLSKQGKELKRLLGHCDETEWTEHSC